MDAVIFDMDGVIVDTMDLHFSSSSDILASAGKNISKKDLEELGPLTDAEVMARFFSDNEEIELLLKKKYDWLFSKTKGIKPIQGFFDFFFQVKGKFPIGLVSNSRKNFIEHIIREIGEENSFDVIVSAEDIGRGKPDPEGYLKAAKTLKVKPANCLVVEDSPTGIIAAKKAGMRVIALTTTHDGNFLLDADLVVSSLKEVDLERAEGLFL